MADRPLAAFRGYIDVDGALIPDDLERWSKFLLSRKGQRVSITVQKERKGRSINQNRRLWAIYTVIAEWSGHDPEEIHEALKEKFLSDLPKRELLFPGEIKLQVGPSTRVLDIEAFGDYMTKCEVWATQQGCELPNWENFE